LRTLYFDLDGTLITNSFGCVKTRLAGGAFERAVRSAKIERLVCVGNAVAIVRALDEIGRAPDALGMIFDLSLGAFEDPAWFRAVTGLIADPRRRAAHIEFSGDWWYVDDLARHYLEIEGRSEMLSVHEGTRIFVPSEDGDGADVLGWLEDSKSRP
jgi:hypothetical protein